ncbi:MAG: hypothetical protein ACH350_10130 [Parachlamydiaceae bacterium]
MNNLSLINLPDANLESYCYSRSSNTLKIRIRTWDYKIIEFIFEGLLAFSDRGGNFITIFQKLTPMNAFENDFYKQIIEKNYEKIENISENLFLFLDIDDNPFLEIVCREVEIKKVE